MKPTFFPTPAHFRAWLTKHHQKSPELLVGFYKKSTAHPSITWPESVDEALCVGWIDGVRKRIDDEAYTIRFTPRKPKSIWSAINIKRVADLTAQNRMLPAGLQAFAARDPKRSAIYAYEQKQADQTLSQTFAQKLKSDPQAHTYFTTQAPSYQRVASYWVMSAKQEKTRLKRMETLISCSQNQTRIPAYIPRKK